MSLGAARRIRRAQLKLSRAEVEHASEGSVLTAYPSKVTSRRFKFNMTAREFKEDKVKIKYRGECEEMYGTEIEVPDHDCRDHAVHKESSHVETHGLDSGPYERWHEEWWECSICGEYLTPTSIL